MIVVFSFSTRIFLAEPSMSSVTFSSLMPRSSLNHLAAGQDRDILEHRLPTVAETRRLDRSHLEPAAQFVDDERGERLTLDILGDDQQGPAALHHRFEHRQHCLETRQLFLMDENVRVLQFGDHLLGVGDEIGREITAVELHALDHVEFGVEALGPPRP